MPTPTEDNKCETMEESFQSFLRSLPSKQLDEAQQALLRIAFLSGGVVTFGKLRRAILDQNTGGIKTLDIELRRFINKEAIENLEKIKSAAKK